MATYDVKRRHYGDKLYEEGDTREAMPGDVAHLIYSGVLVERGKTKPADRKPAAKASRPPENKAS